MNIVFICLGERYPGKRGIRGRGVSGGEGSPGGEGSLGGEEYPRESGIRRRALSGGEGYPGERDIRERGVSGGEGKRNIGKGVKRRKRRRMQKNKGKRCTQRG